MSKNIFDLAEENVFESINNLLNENSKLMYENKQLKADIEEYKEYITVLEQDYKKVNELGLEPSYIKQVIKENERLKAENERLKEYVDKYPYGYSEKYMLNNKKLQQQLKEKDEEIEKYTEYFNAFSCKNFEEFKDFISTFMLTPHEEQTLIRDLENKLKSNTKQVCEKIRKDIGELDDGKFIRAEDLLEDLCNILDQIEKGENNEISGK